MLREVEQLLFLERLGRLEADEARQLAEYQRLSDALMVLPGFEFTATFGFHVLGVFAPGTTVSYLEHLLLSLKLPAGGAGEGVFGRGRLGRSADGLPHDPRGGGHLHRGAREFRPWRGHARAGIRRAGRADAHRLHAGSPTCTRWKPPIWGGAAD